MRKALGRGLEALLPEHASASPAGVENSVAVSEIVPNPDQPRRHFDEEALTSLAESIRRHGLLQPLVVRRIAGRFELIAGERRLQAAKRANLESVPVIVRDARPEDRLELALIENLQRENLTPLEEAEAYRHLMDAYGLTQEEIAQRVGKSRPAITNTLRLLALPDAVKAQLEGGELSAGHARAVLSLEDEQEQVDFAREVVTRKLSKSTTESLAAARSRRPSKRTATSTASDVHVRALAEELTRDFGTRVRITSRARGGCIEIEYYSEAELDRLVERLRSGGPSSA
ncbi:MAG TPA: ParB/RepB/Spo0J family partition protein [Candidatus Binatus sp.]|nr:ParB/RepB/Spo0J family partition protein [Candidatus Binatus sp.]